MHPTAAQLILDEHEALAHVLRALVSDLAVARKGSTVPEFEELRAMLFYLDEVPARMHHVHESELLFPRIRARCPALRPVLDRLEAEHARGESAVRELEHALSAWQLMGETRREAFEIQANLFTSNYLGHMEVEETYVLPVAMDYLSPADWRELEDAFSRQRGALSETGLRQDALYQRILARPIAS